MSSRLPNLSAAADNAAQRMNSREIAELVEKRHDNVKRTIESLVEQGIIQSPQIEDIPTATKPVAVYVFIGEQGKRDSIIIVAQLSPHFTARLVDRWQELEAAQKYTVARMTPRTDVARECRLTMGQHLKMAKMAGLAGNQALIAANRATAVMTGVDPLKLMGITHMTAPQNEALLTPTEIGRRAGGHSAQMVNLLLCTIRFQEGQRDNKGVLYYEPTEEGIAAGGVMQDTGKKHSNGVPIRQLKWSSSIVKVVQDALRPDPVE